MKRHEAVTDKIRDQAAFLSLGLLEPEEARRFEAHLKECPVCEAEVRACAEVAADLAESLPEARPRPSLRQEVLGRAASASVLMRAGDGAWQSPFPGVEVRQLFVDPATRNVTSLVRMKAGAVYPSHRHARLEHCYVLEGDLVFSDHTLLAGDYEVSGPKNDHSSVTTTAGCLLLIINNQGDQLLA